MNMLQIFMAAATAQASPVLQEAFTLAAGATSYMGTFGDAVLLPEMMPTGYQDHLVTSVKALRSAFATAPTSKQVLTRTGTGVGYFIQIIDTSDPVVYTFLTTERTL